MIQGKDEVFWNKKRPFFIFQLSWQLDQEKDEESNQIYSKWDKEKGVRDHSKMK